MKTGVLLCTCSGSADVRYKDVKGIEGAEVVELLDKACSESGLEALKRDIERNDLDSVVFGCVYGKERFLEAVSEAGVNPEMVGFFNARDLCLSQNGRMGVEACKRAVSGEIEKLKSLPDPKNMAVNIGSKAVVVGGDEKSDLLAGNLDRYIDVVQVVPIETEVNELHLNRDFPVYRGDLLEVEGRVGDLNLVFEKNDFIDVDRCNGCGRCRVECDLGAITDGYRVMDICDDCGECVDVCPVGAIEIGRSEKRVFSSDQALVSGELGFDESDFPSGVLVYGEDVFAAASDVIERSGGYRKDVWLDVDRELCSSVGPGGSEGCSYCVDLCPEDAVWIDGEGVNFDRALCSGCGACSSICPVSVPSHCVSNEPLFKLVDSVLYEEGGWLRKDPLRKHVLLFGSPDFFSDLAKKVVEVEIPPYIPVVVDPNSISAAAAVYSACRADAVVMAGGVTPAIDMAQAVVEAAGIGRISVLSGGLDLGWLQWFYGDVEAGNRLDIEPPSDYENRAALTGVLEKAGCSRDLVVEGEYSFGDISISDQCTLCNACANACSTGALEKIDNEIVFRHERCTACGLCVSVCPEECLKLEHKIDFGLLGEDVSVISSEMVCCEKCGREFISMEAYRKVVSSLEGESGGDRARLVKYCEDCRPLFALRDMSGD